MIKKTYNGHKETIHNFIWRSLQIGAKQGTTFFIFFIAAYFLIPEELGMFSYLMALVSLFLIVCDFGFSSATSKYVAQLSSSNSKNLNRVLFSISLVIIGISTIVSLFIIFVGRHIFQDYSLLVYLIPYLFFMPLSSLADGVYRGLKDFKRLSLISLVVAVFSLTSAFILIRAYGLIGAIISQNLLFGLLTLGLFLFRPGIEFKFDKEITKKILKYSLVIGLTGIFYYMYNLADVLILKHFGYLAEIGYYEILNKFFAVVIIPFTLLGQIVAPKITDLYFKDKFLEVKRKFIKQFYFAFLFGITFSIILYFMMPLIIRLFLGKYFVPETILMLNLLLLILPFRTFAAMISQGHTIATGNAHYSLLTMVPAGILNVFLDFYFILIFGFIGVIYSTLICYSLATISFTILYYKKLNKLLVSS